MLISQTALEILRILFFSIIFINLDSNLSVDYEVHVDDPALLVEVLSVARVGQPRAFDDLPFSVGIEEWIRAVLASNQ